MVFPRVALVNSHDCRFVYDSEAQKHARFLLPPSVLISLIRIYVVLPIVLGNMFALCTSRGIVATLRFVSALSIVQTSYVFDPTPNS